MEATLEVLNDLVARGVIEKYAIGGAVGAIFWVEPFDTIDLDVFIVVPAEAPLLDPLRALFADLTQKGFSFEGEFLVIEGIPVQFLPAEDPKGLTKEALDQLGHTLVTGMMGLEAVIVGVVANSHTASLTAAPGPEMFYPVLQRPEQFTGILIRTDGDPAALVRSVRSAVAEVDPSVALTNPGTLQDIVDQSMAGRKLTLNLLIAFAGLALLLASLGVYSVMAYSVAQRNAEIGVRMALGASAGTVQKMVLRHGMTLAGVGLAIGLVASLAVTRLLTTLLFDVGASDPLVYLSIGTLLSAVAALACWLPSRRAARVDPVRALEAR